MKLTVTDKKDNPIFSRTELKFEIDHSGQKTPSRMEASRLVAANATASEDLISINTINSIFGQGKSSGLAHVYKKKEDLEKNEFSYILKRTQKVKDKVAKAQEKKDKVEAEAAAEGTPSPEATEGKAEEQPSEAPAETPKEEKTE